MNIGIFDSGLGGLMIARRVIKALPVYNYIYLGDTERVPYGNRSEKAIYQFTKEAVEYLFKKGCVLVIVACNTASARALRKIQQHYLPYHYPERRVLGVIVPTIEHVLEKKFKRVGIIATSATVNSQTFEKEFKKADRAIRVFQNPAPLLVPLIENGGGRWIPAVAKSYVAPLLKKKIDTLILGSTHYTLIKRVLRRLVGAQVRLISQDDFIPRSLKNYLARHPELERKISRGRKRTFLATDVTGPLTASARAWFGAAVRLKKVAL